MPRNACVIQITPVRLTRTTANDASVVRKIYLSIDPIVTARSHLARQTGGSRPIPKWDPLWSGRQGQAGLFSHYHPFDPSTKWLGRGALAIWLINRVMLPPSHGGRLAVWRRTGHSVPKQALDGCPVQPGREQSRQPGGPQPSDSPDFRRIFP